MNLKDSQGNFLTSLTVVKDQFCVVYDYTSVNIAVADDNTMENVLIPKYALLSQDDYFHSPSAETASSVTDWMARLVANANMKR